MDKMIEVRYAGVVVGRSAIIRELDTRGLFLGITEPLPVGTAISLRIGDRTGTEDVAGRVEVVSESQELARAGMRVRFLDPASARLFGTPSEAAPEPEPEVFPPESTAVDTVATGPDAPGVRDPAAPDASASAAPSGHRRIVVDASTEEKERDAAAPGLPVADDLDLSGPSGADAGRIPAPDAAAFGGSGRKTRRNKKQR